MSDVISAALFLWWWPEPREWGGRRLAG